MSSKEYYYVPVYVMLAEDFVCGEVDFKFLDKIIVSETKNGYQELNGFNNFVILNTTLTNDLINEGIAREIVSKVQQMRKNINLELTDRIIINYNASEDIISAVNDYADYIKRETLATEIKVSEDTTDEFTVNDLQVKIAISKK